MAHPASAQSVSSTPDPLIGLFRPSHPALAAAYESPEEWARIFRLLVREEAENVYQQRAEKERREKLVPAEGVYEIVPITGRYALALARRGELKGHRKEGTRRVYFRVGELIDWQEANMREDGSIKRTRRKSAAVGKKKGGK